MKTKTLLLGSALLAVSLSANPYQSSKEEMASIVETGKKASDTLLKTLGGNLTKHLQDEGVLGAVKFCSTNALSLTEKVDNYMGKNVTLKRISKKYRNPANRPDIRESAVLTSFEMLQENRVILPEYLLEQVDEETYRYYKPLLINKEVCLACHGNVSQDPQLSEYLKKNYPEDKALHYELGDLRGAIVVTIKK